MSLNIDSPCLKKCELDENNVCLGCFRTFDDMCCWHNSNDDEKIKMLYLAKMRQNEYVTTQKSKIFF
jgi:predicted Fe-S protein YdhL (DUF1289 family)